MNADQALRAGGDLYMDGVFRNGSFSYGYTQAKLSAAMGTGDEAKAIDYYVNLRRAAKDVLYVWLNARETNLRYNEQVQTAMKTGEAPAAEELIERPVKTGGLPVVGTVVAIVDCIVAVLIVLRVHRAFGRGLGARRSNDRARK
jgi:beta-glucosidase